MLLSGVGFAPVAETLCSGEGITLPEVKSGFRVSEVRVEDFRALRDVRVPLSDSTLLVGSNNSGKTSFLEALAVVFGRHPDEADFHVSGDGTRSTRFLIDVRLEPTAGREFPEDLAQLFGGAVQLPKDGSSFVAIRTTVTAQADGSSDLQRAYLRGWPLSRVDKVAELPTRPSRDALETVSFNILDARRDVVEEMRNRRSWWGRLTSRLDLAPETARAIEGALGDVSAQIVEGSALLAQVRDHLRGVQAALGATDVAIAPLAVRVDELAKGMDVVLRAPRSASLPIARQGMGARSLASLLVFRTFVQVRLGARGSGRPPLPLTALEEPEAHVHPQGQRAVFRLISEIPGQRLISTHSPFVAAPADVFDFRVFSRDGSETTCRWIERTSGGTPIFTDDELQKVQRFVLRRNAEVLFARVVILFEGETEAAALPLLARKRWADSDAEGVSFVDMGGAGNLRHAVRLLYPLGIPWVILVDGDTAGQAAVAGVRTEIGATEDQDIPVVSLTSARGGLKLEEYLLAEGHGGLIRDAIAAEFGPDALTGYERRNQGRYSGEDGPSQLLVDFMDREKVRCGRAFAELACERNVMPTAVRELFDRVDKVLKGGGS